MPTLPAWNDAQSVSLYLAALFSLAVTVLGIAHVAIPKGAAEDASTIAGVLGVVISLAVNVVTHRKAHATAMPTSGTPSLP